MSADDRWDIEQCLLTYCRGIDRLDEELIRGAFHPEAVVDYGGGEHPIEEFASYAVARLRSRYVATQHRITNVYPEIAGDHARCEAYVLAFHVQVEGDDEWLHTFSGRYLDRFERREGRWAIARRDLRCDWTRCDPTVEHMAGSFIASARDRSDVLYQLELD